MLDRPRRSALYMPATNARALEKARSLPADAVIIDLEDSIAPSSKAEARAAAAAMVTAGGFGRRYEHPLTRTVTQMDNMLFSNMTLNPQPLHIDRHFCETETEWGQPIMNSLFTLGLLGVRRNRILEIDHHGVGAAGHRLF